MRYSDGQGTGSQDPVRFDLPEIIVPESLTRPNQIPGTCLRAYRGAPWQVDDNARKEQRLLRVGSTVIKFWMCLRRKKTNKTCHSFRAKAKNAQANKLFKGSIIDQDFEDHTRTRRLLAPAFKSDAIRAYLPTMLQIAHSQMEHWVTKSGPDGQTLIDIQSEIRQLTLRMAFTLLLGADLPLEDFDVGHALAQRYDDLFLGMIPWPIGPWDGAKRSELARARIIADVTEVIKQRRDVLEGNGGKEENSRDPLWLLMQAVDENGDR